MGFGLKRTAGEVKKQRIFDKRRCRILSLTSKSYQKDETVAKENNTIFKCCDGLMTIILKSRNTRIVGEADESFKACIRYADELEIRHEIWYK